MKLNDVFPQSSAHYSACGSAIDSVLSGELPSAHTELFARSTVGDSSVMKRTPSVVSTNSADQFRGQLLRMSKALRILASAAGVAGCSSSTSTLEHVPSVFGGRADVQMARAHAGGVVAFVQDVLTTRNRAVLKHVRSAMRVLLALHWTAQAEKETSIAVLAFLSRPYPASRLQTWMSGSILVNLLPETNRDVFGVVRVWHETRILYAFLSRVAAAI